MKTTRCLVVIILFVALNANTSFAQIQEPSYTLTFLKGKYVDTTKPKETVLIFKREVKPNNSDKLIISGKMSYTLGNSSKQKTAILGRSDNQHTITVFGGDIEAKGKHIFELIKDNPNFGSDSSACYIVFFLRDINKKYINKMTFTYGLWEPADENVRIETTYQVKIDP